MGQALCRVPGVPTKAGFLSGAGRKCGTHEALDFSTLRFGTRGRMRLFRFSLSNPNPAKRYCNLLHCQFERSHRESAEAVTLCDYGRKLVGLVRVEIRAPTCSAVLRCRALCPVSDQGVGLESDSRESSSRKSSGNTSGRPFRMGSSLPIDMRIAQQFC